MIAEHNDITVPDTGEEFSWHEVPLPELSQDPPWEPLPSTGQWTAQSGGQTLSTIHDQGYDAWLKQQAEDQEDESASRQSPRSPTHARSPSESRQSTAVLVAQTGAFFDAPWPSPPAQPPPSPQDFETEIRAALKVSASRDKGEYLPNDAFNRIVTRDRVRQELARLVPERIAADKLDWYTDQVWHTTPPVNSKSHDPRPTTRRKIFAILALIQMVPGIVRFIDDSDENVHDNDLPFLLSDGPDPGTRQLQRRGRDGNLSPITIVSSWPPFMHEVFNDYQWKLLPPYFVLSTTTRPEVPHYSFEYGTVLPLIEDEKIASGNTGGFGDVWKVKIHPAHHNRCHNASSDKDNPWYAIKRLRHSNREAFRVEVSNLKRFSTKDHLHIIKLLGTFEWRREFYLLFPCADGNLFDFWKLYPTVTELPRDHGFALWFSSQCLGLAKGLKSIHSFEVTQGEYLDIPQHEQDKTLGRHGDLIPENILWFRPVGPYLLHETDKGNMGVLKISDFALSKFHRPASVRSGQDGNGKSTPVSPRYRAPEFDIGQGVDQSYDIWTLGCVLLEFVAWYVLGWDEVERFSRSRVEDDYGEIKEDVFFNNVEIIHEEDEKKETWTEPGAQAKRAVYDEFQLLYKHERCSDFILDLLDFIEDRLLRIRPYKRAKCDEIVDKLTSLHKTCQENNRYCTERQKLDLRRSRTDLSLVASSALPYSDKQKKRIHQNAVPNIHPQPIFPSVASQLAAAGLVPSTSRTERYKEGINSIFSDRKDEHNTPYESFGELATSSAASIPVPSFTITVSPPPSKFTTTTSTTPPRSSCTEDTSNDTGNDTAVPFAQASTEATPSSSQQKPARRERWYKRILR
ncbi:kinase-like domain-containing protein [Rhypophila decipiens]|uniref:Kinase-like domain-containing protein n=1 Tax=Rhypophila decipiens TaxID=261697 RepID=A0AAN6XVH1_9PEZI|nr:kinase-like domain-containing protein [Rhypophila decipiens]